MSTSLRLLRRHVVESNLIEEITSRIGPHYDSHFAAARAVARRRRDRPVMNPRVIHRILSRGTEMESFGGKIRNCPIIVGKYATPRPKAIRGLLRKWWLEVVHIDATIHTVAMKDRELLAFFYHNWLLLIHPFQDGNGRTSRIFLNMLRLRWGLPWLIIEDRRKWGYYAQIAHQGNAWFRKEYPPKIYPTDDSRRYIRDPGPWWMRKSLEEIYADLPTGRVPMRISIRPRN